MVSFRKLFPVLAVVALVLVTVDTASAQLTCSNPVAVAPRKLVRAEGITELVSPVYINCTVTAAGAGGGSGLKATFQLSTTQNVTSGKNPDVSTANVDVRLRIVAGVGGQAAPTVGADGNAVLAGGTVLSTTKGTLSSDTFVEWANVSIPFAAGATNVQFVVDNLRLNATQTDGSFTPMTASVRGFSVAGFTTDFSVDDTLDLAVARPGINGNRVSVASSSNAGATGTLQQCTDLSGDPSSTNYQRLVTIQEGFGTAYRNAETTDWERASGFSGYVNRGTRIIVKFAAIPTGATVSVGNASVAGSAVLTLVGSDGVATSFTAVTPDATGAASVTYEVSGATAGIDNPQIPVAIRYASGGAALGTATVAATFSPISDVMTSSGTRSLIPRFKDITTGNFRTLFSVNACTSTLLFPYVTSAGGWDTGIAIVNSSLDIKRAGSSKYLLSGGDDPVPAQSGTCSLYYFGTGAPTTNPATTSVPVAAGASLVMTVSGGLTGSGIAAAPGFSGYMLAQCNFQNAHGFAFLNGTASSGSAGVGYNALVLNPGSDATFTGTVDLATGAINGGTISFPASRPGITSKSEGLAQ